MTHRTSVLIVDDHPLFREGVARTVHDDPGMTVVGQADSCAGGLALAKQTLPDVILQDLKLPDGTGLDAITVLQAQCPLTKIIVLTAVEDEEALLAALKAGASGYLLKGVSSRELVSVIRAVADGETYVTPRMAGRLLQEMSPRHGGERPGGIAELTERERSILELVSKGLTNREIAERLYLSEKTVKHYMTNILRKLRVRNRVEAALLLSKKKSGL